MSKKKRICAFVLTVFIACVMLLSSVFIISHAEHDCIGEGCSICATLYACEESLKMLALAIIVSILFSTKFCASCATLFQAIAFPFITLVSLKVKLSN